MLVLNRPKPPSIECRSLGKKPTSITNRPINKEKNSYIRSFLEPIKTPIPIELEEVVQLNDDIHSDIDVYSIELEVKTRLTYMFEIPGKLRIEYQDIYRSKLRHAIGASLHNLVNKEQIRAILINY